MIRKNKQIILAAVFLALLLVLSRFLSVKTPIMKISFAFVPTMLCAVYLGWKWTLVVNVLGDLIGAILFPSGAFFIGYTITTAVAALIYGLLLYKKTPNAIPEWKFALKTILATVLVAVIANMFLNTFWLKITTGQAFWVLLGTRIVKQLVMIPIHIVVILLLERILRKPAMRYLYDSEEEQDASKNDSNQTT